MIVFLNSANRHYFLVYAQRVFFEVETACVLPVSMIDGLQWINTQAP